MRRVGRVDDVEEQRGLERLVERRPERRDEIVRELLDEAHGVRDEHARLRLRLQRAHGRVERREELVLDEHLAAGERAHQRRLAGVRVADERDAELVVPRVAPVLLLLLDRDELLAELGDAVADLASIELDRRLAGALAALALLASGRLAQPRRHVVEARDLDLRAAPRGSARGDGRCRR